VSDVVAVGLITGGVSLVGAAITALVTTRVSKRQGENELEKLASQQHEEQRLRRVDAYRQLMSRISELDSYATGPPPSREELERVVKRFTDEMLAVELVAKGDVASALDVYITIINRSSTERDQALAGELSVEEWQNAYAPNRAAVEDAWNDVLRSMHADVGPGA
jgi:hypothetical protein